MVVKIYDVINKKYVEAEIVPASTTLPLKKEGWKFDWNKQLKEKNTKIYLLRLKNNPKSIEGIVQLKNDNNMLIMNLLEIAPHNIGTSKKKFENVAGCLIAFACRESFKIKGVYKGYLSFMSKTKLMDWYRSKYGATQALGARMYFDDIAGEKLIKKYLK